MQARNSGSYSLMIIFSFVDLNSQRPLKSHGDDVEYFPLKHALQLTMQKRSPASRAILHANLHLA